MTDNDKVVMLHEVTNLDIPAERVLEAAKESLPETAVVMGWDEHGELYFASSNADSAEVMWLLRRCEHMLLNLERGDE